MLEQNKTAPVILVQNRVEIQRSSSIAEVSDLVIKQSKVNF